MQQTFDTPNPISLHVELGSGDLSVDAEDVDQTVVNVDGKNADDVTVEQRGDQIVVLAPQRKAGFFAGNNELSIAITVPTDSELSTKLGSADLVSSGRLGATRIKTGSGDVRLDHLSADASIETGSGDIDVDTVAGDLRVKTGSGDVEVDRLDGNATVSTGSGDVEIGTAHSDVQVKSGSGDLRVGQAHRDLALSTASGDLTVGRFEHGELQAKNVSGDIHVGIPANIPVWTDISAVTGRVSSNLDGAGQPEEGQDYIELRAKTVSGDIVLEQL